MELVVVTIKNYVNDIEDDDDDGGGGGWEKCLQGRDMTVP